MNIRKTAAAALLTLTLVGVSAPATADNNPPGQEQVCPDGDVPKTDTSGDPATVEYTAPAGYVVYQYCVKAGSDGYIIVTVDPPTQTVTIDHPTKDSVSNWSVWYKLDTTTTTTVAPTTTEAPTTTV